MTAKSQEPNPKVPQENNEQDSTKKENLNMPGGASEIKNANASGLGSMGRNDEEENAKGELRKD